MYYILVTALILLDQIVKYMIKANMSLYESIPLIDGIFHITYIENTGAAFSILEGQRWLLILLPAALCITILYLLVKERRKAPKVYLWSLSLLVAGGAGNLIDRISYGSVCDFLDFRIWPVFNIADICVCVGCGLLVIYMIFMDKKK